VRALRPFEHSLSFEQAARLQFGKRRIETFDDVLVHDGSSWYDCADDNPWSIDGIISGPTVFGVCDAALYYACFTVMGIEPMVLTSEMSIRFLRPARGDTLRAKAVLDHAGRRSMIGTVTAWTDDSDKPVAVAQGTYVAPIAG